MQQRHVIAVLLSVAAHAIVTLAVVKLGGASGTVAGHPPAASPSLAVRLVTPGGTGMPSTPRPAPAVKPVQQAAAPPPPSTQQIQSPSPHPIPAPVGIRYFQAGELTQEPLAVDGPTADRMLIVPGVAPQAATVRISVDDQGNVESIAFEKEQLTDEEERLVTEAFLKLKFHPGKIGRIAVRSQVTRDVLLDSTLRF
jgi:outer membrane biosynthesis protein TonB